MGWFDEQDDINRRSGGSSMGGALYGGGGGGAFGGAMKGMFGAGGGGGTGTGMVRTHMSPTPYPMPDTAWGTGGGTGYAAGSHFGNGQAGAMAGQSRDQGFLPRAFGIPAPKGANGIARAFGMPTVREKVKMQPYYGQMTPVPYAPPAGGTLGGVMGGGTVRLQGPDGSTRDVPAMDAKRLIALGATVMG